MRQARSQLKRNIASDIVENDDENDEGDDSQHPRINIFSFLLDDEEEDVERTEGINDDLDAPSHPLPSPLPPSLLRRRKAEAAEGNLRRGATDDTVTSTHQKVLSPLELLLLSERKFLNFDAENRRKFGRSTATPSQSSRSSKLYTLVTPEAHWSVTPTRLSGGFSMTRSSESHNQFTFVISDEYNSIRDSYFAAESSGDPEIVFEMAARVPFCTEALLQLFEYHRTVGNNEAAVSTLRQCLFSLESSFHPNFLPWKQPAKVLYNPASIDRKLFNLHRNIHDVPLCGPNELLFIALFRYVQLCSKRACTETAFECAKLLLSLSPEEDPMRILLVLDAYALRAGRSKWIVEVTDTSGPQSRVPLLFLPFSDLHILAFPGWLFARALSLFKLESAGTTTKESPLHLSLSTSSSTFTSITSDSSICNLDATHLLVRALLTYPHLLFPLLRETGIKETDIGVNAHGVRLQSLSHPSCTPVSQMGWNQLFKERLFSQPHLPGETSTTNVETAPLWSDQLRKLVDITASLQSVVWANPIHLSFLFTCARLAAFAYNCAADDEPEKVVDNVNVSEDRPSFQVKNSQYPERYFASTIFAVAEAVTGTLAREEVFFPSDNTDTITKKIRIEALKRYGCVRSIDYKDDAIVPIAEDFIADLQHNDHIHNDEAATFEDPRHNPLNLLNRSPFLLFFDSMLPWNVLPYQTNDETTIWRGL